MNPIKTVKTIEANLTDLVRVCKEVKKREEEGTLPANGKLTAVANEQAQALLSQNSSQKLDCSDYGRIRYVFDRINPENKIKNALLTRAFNDKMLLPNVPNLMNAFTPEELKDWAVTELVQRALPPYKLLKKTQKLLEGSIQAYEEHESRCARLAAANELIAKGTREVIATVTYKAPESTTPVILPFSAILKSTPTLKLPTPYEKITYKLPKQPEIKTSFLPPLKFHEPPTAQEKRHTPPIASNEPSTPSLGNIELSVSKLRPKHVDISASGVVDGATIGAGLNVSLKKPLSSRFVINMPIEASPIPLCVSVNGQLNRLHKMQFKLEVPLDPIDKLVSVVGIKCPASLPVISIKVKNVVKKIKKIFGKTKKHKHKEKTASELAGTVTRKVSYVNFPENTPISAELITACKKIADDLKQMDASTHQLSHEVSIAVEGIKDLKEELEELYTNQVALQKDFEAVQADFNTQKNLLATLPALQAQAATNQQQLNNLTAVMHANLTLDRINQIKTKFSPEEAARIAAQAKAIANLNN